MTTAELVALDIALDIAGARRPEHRPVYLSGTRTLTCASAALGAGEVMDVRVVGPAVLVDHEQPREKQHR